MRSCALQFAARVLVLDVRDWPISGLVIWRETGGSKPNVKSHFNALGQLRKRTPNAYILTFLCVTCNFFTVPCQATSMDVVGTRTFATDPRRKRFLHAGKVACRNCYTLRKGGPCETKAKLDR